MGNGNPHAHHYANGPVSPIGSPPLPPSRSELGSPPPLQPTGYELNSTPRVPHSYAELPGGR